MDAAAIDRDTFENASFFFVPMRVDDREALLDYFRQSGEWEPDGAPFDLKYILCYAASLDSGDDKRLVSFRLRAPEKTPLYLFDRKIAGDMEKWGNPQSGCTPRLGSVCCRVFGSGIAFLELCVYYGGMSVSEISDFIYLFRSLRNGESKDYLGYPAGTVGLKTAIENWLPAEKTGLEPCFSSCSDVKRQANVFTVLHTGRCADGEASEETLSAWRSYLAHGYNEKFFDLSGDDAGQYEMRYTVSGKTYWGGSQDGLVCITTEPYDFQYRHLCSDYRFLYLLLLNQRYASFALIDELSKSGDDPQATADVHHRVVELMSQYAFRVISDDRYVQTVFSRMHAILMLDELLKDLEESNARVAEVHRAASEKEERRVNRMLIALSVLAISSALIDLADFLGSLFSGGGVSLWAIVSLAVNVIIVGVFVYILRNKQTEK